MGNSFAKSAKCDSGRQNTAVCPPTMAPPPPCPPPPTTTPESKCQDGNSPILPPVSNNPGTMDEFHKRCKEILPMPIEGLKIVINKSLSQQFQVSHNLTMSSIQPSGYRYGSTYVGPMLSPTEPSSLWIGDIDPSGNLNAQGFYHLSNALKFKWAAQIMSKKYQGLQTSLDFKGDSFTITGSVVNPSIATESGIGVIQYLQAINPRVALGGEVMYQKSQAIPEGSMTLFTASARYNDPLMCISGFLGQAGAGFYAYRKINDELQIGIEIERIQQQFSASIGYQYDVPKANFTMKAMIDNNWTVTGMFEKRLLPMPCVFALCGSINHIKNQFRMGCQVNIEL